MAVVPTYPVRVGGKLDPHLSPWLWLVKWLLLIPHFIVLLFLWLAYFVVSIVAFFAIVFTGRYPRSIFDFNVGVLRWTWRVAFYGYSALATDRYPPFSLGEEPDYPATLHVEYPTRLSRGLVWVKWWLLAIPHYIVIGFFIGAGWAANRYGGGGGLIFVLALIAGFALLFTRRYPDGIFDFVLGLNRWVVRVAAYASLMTDAYPPFRIDLGGQDPARLPVGGPPPGGAPAVAAAGAGALAADPPAPSGPGGVPDAPSGAAADPAAATGKPHVVGTVLASIACLIGFLIALAGIGIIVVDLTQRDSDGYLTTPSRHFGTTSYAITSETVDVPVTGPDNIARDLIGNVRIKSESSAPVFIGIARQSAASAYLASVNREVVDDLDKPSGTTLAGRAPGAPPTAQKFWSVSTQGSGLQTLDWKVKSGHWVAVVMRPNGGRGVYADLRIGAQADNLGWIGAGVLAGGLLLLAIGATGLYFALRRTPTVTPAQTEWR